MIDLKLHPICSGCGKENKHLNLGDNEINGILCMYCKYELSEDDCLT